MAKPPRFTSECHRVGAFYSGAVLSDRVGIPPINIRAGFPRLLFVVRRSAVCRTVLQRDAAVFVGSSWNRDSDYSAGAAGRTLLRGTSGRTHLCVYTSSGSSIIPPLGRFDHERPGAWYWPHYCSCCRTRTGATCRTPEEVIFAIPSASGRQMREAHANCLPSA
jgi:hypothetical protein